MYICAYVHIYMHTYKHIYVCTYVCLHGKETVLSHKYQKSICSSLQFCYFKVDNERSTCKTYYTWERLIIMFMCESGFLCNMIRSYDNIHINVLTVVVWCLSALDFLGVRATLNHHFFVR